MSELIIGRLAEQTQPDPDAHFQDREGAVILSPVPEKDLEDVLAPLAKRTGVSPAQFVGERAVPFLEKCNFAEKVKGGWQLLPENLPTHQLALRVLEEKQGFLIESKIRSIVAKSMGKKVRETKLWLLADKRFRVATETEIPAKKVQGRGRLWGRVGWRLVNSPALEIVQEAGAIKKKDIIERAEKKAHLRTDLQAFFQPELDKRFAMEGGRWGKKTTKKKEEPTVISKREKRLRKEVGEKIDQFFEAQEPTKSVSRENLLSYLLGPSRNQASPSYLGDVDDVLSVKEGAGELVRVRFSEDNPYWRKASGLPTDKGIVGGGKKRGMDEGLLVGDAGLTMDLLLNLQSEVLYWLDGDFAEDGFPGVEPLLIITLNDFLNDEVTPLPPPLATALNAVLVPPGNWAEFEVELPGGESLVVLADFAHSVLYGLAAWINASAALGSVLTLEYRSVSRFRLEVLTPIRVPQLEDAEIEQLQRLQESPAEEITDLAGQILGAYPEGLGFEDLLHRFLFIRRVSRRALASALVSTFAFEAREGRWRFHEGRTSLGRRLSVYSAPVMGTPRRAWFWTAPSSLAEGDKLKLPPGMEVNEGDVIGCFNETGKSVAACVATKKKGGMVVERVLSWSPIETADLNLSTGWEEADPCDLMEILAQGEEGLIEAEIYSGFRKAFGSFQPEIAINQDVTQDLQELELLLGEGGMGGALGGLSWQMKKEFTWKTFQRILDEKYYSREDATRMDTEVFTQWLIQRPISWDAPTLILPTGSGETAVSVLETLLTTLETSDYAVTDDGLAVKGKEGREFLFPWVWLVSDQRRIKRIVEGEESLEVDDFLRGWFRHLGKLVDHRKLQVAMTRLSLHLKGLSGIEIEETGVRSYLAKLRKAQRKTLGESVTHRFSNAIVDLRALGSKECSEVMGQVPSAMGQGACLIVLTGPGQRIKLPGVIESEAHMGAVLARATIL